MLDKLQYWWKDAKLGIRVGQGDALKRQFTLALERLIDADDSFQTAFASKAAEVFVDTTQQYGGSFNNVSKTGHLKIAKQLIAESNRVFDLDMPHGYALMFMYFLVKSAALPGESAKHVFDRCNLIFIRHIGEKERQNVDSGIEGLFRLGMSPALKDVVSKSQEPGKEQFIFKLQKFIIKNELEIDLPIDGDRINTEITNAAYYITGMILMRSVVDHHQLSERQAVEACFVAMVATNWLAEQALIDEDGLIGLAGAVAMMTLEKSFGSDRAANIYASMRVRLRSQGLHRLTYKKAERGIRVCIGDYFETNAVTHVCQAARILDTLARDDCSPIDLDMPECQP